MAELPKGGGGGKGQSKGLPPAPSKEALDAAIQKAQKNGTHVKNTVERNASDARTFTDAANVGANDG